MPLPRPTAGLGPGGFGRTGVGPGGLPATTDLGLGSMLSDQVVGETEEQRKKRMAQMQQSGNTTGLPPATSALFPGGLSGFSS